MVFGIDTVEYLNTIDWAKLYNWKGEYPGFAGRYFGSTDTWKGTEFTDAKSSTNGVLDHIAPLRGCDSGRQSTTGSTGFSYGQEDGTNCCDRIVNAMNAGQLSLPPGDRVYVYLDVEEGVDVSPQYYSGWASSIYEYAYGALQPFLPGVYTQFVDSGGLYYPNSYVKNALDSAQGDHPNLNVRCAGFWSNEPEPCAYCDPAASPDWSGVFGTYKQPVSGGDVVVPVMLWQYAEKGGCVTACGYGSTWAGGQTVDLDGSDETGAEDYMLVIA
jgi:hypothetical protein